MVNLAKISQYSAILIMESSLSLFREHEITFYVSRVSYKLYVMF